MKNMNNYKKQLPNKMTDIAMEEKEISLIRDKRSYELDRRIMDIFLSVGISANLQGYQYLRESIKMVMHNPSYIGGITKTMYPKIAEKYNTTPCRVERAIRHALEVAYNKGKMIRLNDVLGVNVIGDNERPTNSEFVAIVADKLTIEGR